MGGVMQRNAQVGRGKVIPCLLRPFDEADRLALKVFVQACIEVFFRLTESIKIKVMQV
jgi:hypothetical protein